MTDFSEGKWRIARKNFTRLKNDPAKQAIDAAIAFIDQIGPKRLVSVLEQAIMLHELPHFSVIVWYWEVDNA